MGKRSMFDELKQGLQEMKAHREGKVTLKTTEVDIPPPIKMSKTKIQKIRKGTNFSQPIFARVLGVNVSTYQNWEQGRSEPNAQAKLLLEMVNKSPAFLQELTTITTGRAIALKGKKALVIKKKGRTETKPATRVATAKAKAPVRRKPAVA
jgi:putative transcriptional regulator